MCPTLHKTHSRNQALRDGWQLVFIYRARRRTIMMEADVCRDTEKEQEGNPDCISAKEGSRNKLHFIWFTSTKTLCSYVPKKNRAVMLVSFMHHSVVTTVDKNTKNLKLLCNYNYNSTKGGFDEADKKCSIYSSSRRTSVATVFRKTNNNHLTVYLQTIRRLDRHSQIIIHIAHQNLVKQKEKMKA